MALDPVSAIADLAQTAINKIWPDAGEAERNKITTILALASQQSDINKIEAASPSIFVSGWRPFIGWCGGVALAYTYIGYPLLLWAAALLKPELHPPILSNDGVLFELILALLGLGGMRSFEKLKGVA